ncbi:isoleucine--tRNA ligase [Porphyromonas sp.]|uniref:isoleucine--tRNA ligase n=1 Tax=Porphyromonas sp. TaxID=1924944 RepID=UPI0026DC31CE|nr:isoleucine--tRNA ligase [Porphyromonas sp.]MDO4771511.1 isoleucine--tRNA ligase [Porphyromonas sp.]
MADKYKEYNHLNLSEINKEMLKIWEEEQVFGQSLKIREDAPKFIFYEGPPSANGMPGIHHVIARTLKDIFCRYKTMKGFMVDRKAGWDTHGLPVELGVEKKLGITKADIGTKITVAEYNAACKEEVMKYTNEWQSLTNKMGYWVDMDHPYITYDNRYIETLWYLLKQLYKKGLLYKGYTIQPYSPAAGTGLSSHELNQPGCYRDVKDTTCTAQFEVVEPKEEMKGHGDVFFLAWTTTPWTLPSNTALCVGPNITYVAVRTFNPYTNLPMTAVMAKDLMPTYFPAAGAEVPLSAYKAGDKVLPYEIVAEYKGSDLVGMAYRQLIPWVNPGEGAFRVISGDFVTTEDGTGIVHIAPTFGADDDKVAKANGVPPLMMKDRDGKDRPMVDLSGKYYKIEDLDEEWAHKYVDIPLYDIYAGRYVKNAYDETLTEADPTLDVDLCVMLKQQNQVFRIEKHVHNYPHCWRTDKPILYYPLDSWFIRSTAVRERMMELNETICWKPQSTGTGRFGKWLENLQDWNLSRSRYWGTPLPIWRTEDGSEEICIGSIKELYAEIEKSIKAGVMTGNPFKGFVVGEYTDKNYDRIDLHRPYVDEIVLVSPSGKPMNRETDLIDVWFDSGAMPYAQVHYPFEHGADIETGKMFPADFIAEGVDQTRGWFFTLHALGTMLFDSVAFRTVISNGLVLDKNGNKMSKRLGNGVDPFETIEKNGSDPLRWYMITNASPWDNLKFDPDGVEEVQRKFFGTLYNTYSFFALYANIDGFDHSVPMLDNADRPELDRWILSMLNSLIKEVDKDLNDYEPTRAARAISDFVNDHLSNWYVRLSRKRFWGGGMSEDKLSAYQTLHTCLTVVSRLIAPFAPFYADHLYRDLSRMDERYDSSVHLADFPVCDESVIDKKLEEEMRYAQTISSMILALRRKVNIKVRQPLTKILVLTSDAHQMKAIDNVKEIIINEVNIKQLIFADNASGIVVKRIKPNFKALGPKFGKTMKSVAAYLTELPQEDILAFERNGSMTYEGQEINIADVEIISEDIPGWLVQNEGALTVALDVTITDELRNEGLARELVNRIQNIRKSKNFNVSDKVRVQILSHAEINPAVKDFEDYISTQVQAVEMAVVQNINDAEILDMDGMEVKVKVEKA